MILLAVYTGLESQNVRCITSSTGDRVALGSGYSRLFPDSESPDPRT